MFRKRKSVAESIIQENSAHEGRPRTVSPARAQESWEEFKERANQPFEDAIERISGARQPAARVWRQYRAAILFGAGAVAAFFVVRSLLAKKRISDDVRQYEDEI